MAEMNQAPSGGDKEKKIQSKKMSTRIDMTPMVDLAFLLLTFFMLATTFNKPQTMEITMPDKPKEEDNQPLVNEKRVLNLLLAGDDKIYWYVGLSDPDAATTDYSSRGIREVLITQNGAIKDMVVLIKPTDKSTYQNLVDILDEMQITNISRYALVEPAPEDAAVVRPSNAGTL